VVRSVATILIAMGIHVKVIQELLGHSNIALTLNIYGHALPSMQAEASEKWDDLFGEQDERGATVKLKANSRGESSSGRPPEDYQKTADSFFKPDVWLLLVPLDSLCP